MAVGNTFGATALSSFGGFWIAFGIILTPGGFEIESTLEGVSDNAFADSFGFFLMVSPVPVPPASRPRLHAFFQTNPNKKPKPKKKKPKKKKKF